MPPHPTAQLHPRAKVHPSAEIGAGAIVEADVEIQRDARIGDHTIVRSGTLLRRGAEVGNGCDIAAFYVGRDTKLGDGVRMDASSSVGDNATIGNSVHFETRARAGHHATVSKGTTLGPGTYIHAGAHLGENVTTGKDVRIGESVHVGNGTTFADEARVAPNAHIGDRTSVGKKAGIGMDGGPGVIPPARIGNDCTLGDETVIAPEARMSDGCTLEANAELEHGAVMEPGSTVCAGSKVRPDAAIREGETVPPSTLVRTDGTQVGRHIDIDDYNFRDNDDDREVFVHPDDEPRRVAEDTPPTPSTAPDKVWIVIDINGEPHPKHGYFGARKECRDHISTNIDSAEDRMYDRDSMFGPAAVERAANDKNTDGAAIWIVKTDRFLSAQHGFFQSRERAAENREPDETIARIQPARQHERDRENKRTVPRSPDHDTRSLPPTPPPAPSPAADAARRADQTRDDGPSR